MSRLGLLSVQGAPSPGVVAEMFGVPVERVRAQYRANARQLGELAAKAEARGGKVRGYTAEEWRRMAASAEAKAGMP